MAESLAKKTQSGTSTKKRSMEQTLAKTRSKTSIGKRTRVTEVRLFCSYAHPDSDIVQAFLTAFRALNSKVNHNIIPFSDKAIQPGLRFDNEIKGRLSESDYLLVFYTGALKPSHSYTGYEVGFFDAQVGDSVDKRIVSFFMKKPPDPAVQIQGVDIGISPDLLARPRQEYIDLIKEVAKTPQGRSDALTEFFVQVAELAEKRSPLVEDRGSEREDRYRTIREEVVPGLRADLYDCLSSRVARNSVEQREIRFELPKPEVGAETISAIPDETVLSEEGSSFQLFGIRAEEAGKSWREFRTELGERSSTSPALYAIERALVTAVSLDTKSDNNQIIKAQDNNLYRVVVTELVRYYDRRLIVRMWFIPFLQKDYYGDPETSILLSFILVAAKYRFLFLEDQSPLSLEKFRKQTTSTIFQDKVRKLLRETILIEQESSAFKLDTPAALVLIAGTGANIDEVGEDMKRYAVNREAMEVAANAILKLKVDVAEFDQAREKWLTTLEAFLDSSGRINSEYTVRALKTLAKHFEGARSSSSADATGTVTPLVPASKISSTS